MVSIAIIGGESSGRSSLAAKLGKKGNETDITMYDFTKGKQILTIIDPSGYPASPKPLMTALAMVDMVLLCIPPKGMDAAAGECVIAIDLLGIKQGILVQTMADMSNPYELQENANTVRAMLKDTTARDWDIMAVSTNTFEGMEELKEAINDLDEKITAQHLSTADQPSRVIIDHSFNVKGIGSVVLGRVTRGTIHKHDKCSIHPIKRELEIRSIQMHDIDTTSAPSGSRVGLALKGVQAKEVNRGHIISAEEVCSDDIELECNVSRFSPGLAVGSTLHMYVTLQSSPVKISGIVVGGTSVPKAEAGNQCRVHISTEEELAFNKDDIFILSDLNSPRQRFIAAGRLPGDNGGST
ncbi:MAG: EF-Tu/IF-2/RF-3 family GTPase [ANME-2 cluster archaeon]|nr:EF-Tu/IF-2/RF-3 family GTPase [ANME-2 cluster archaeon]